MDLITIALYLTIVVIALTIHEFCHAWAGHMLGDVTAKQEGRLTLNPMSHIDPFSTLLLPAALIFLGSPVVFGAAKPVPFNPYAVRYGKWGAALIAIAGPTSNLLMATVVGLYLRVFDVTGVAGQFLLQFVLINLAFFVFNMIPIPPLDGSRVLYVVLPSSLQDIMDQIEKYGIIVIFAFLLIFYQLFSPLIISAVTWLATLILGQSPVL
ncbi:MAG TPA: site-2 protease family protein [Candidatus Saccharibacteria bacterium]|nr:site-2 protease family protein [Candidatus Saccharibacteria bacterium]